MSAARARALEERYIQSPIHSALGLRLEVDDDGTVAVHYDGSEAGRNRRGNTAGGTTATMIDSAVVQATMAQLGEDDVASTIELKVNYVLAGREGEALIARGRLIHVGRSTAVGLGEVTDAQGREIAVGLVTVNIRRAGS